MPKKRYQNYDGIDNGKTFSDMRRWFKERRSKIKDLTVQIPQCKHKEITDRARDIH